MDGSDILSRMRMRHSLGDDARVGVMASFGKGTTFKAAGDQRLISCVFNTDDVDLEAEVVVPAGRTDAYWKRNGYPIFADHRYSLSDVIGTVRGVPVPYPSADNCRGWRCEVSLRKTSPLADNVWNIVQELGSIGWSIGFRTNDWRPATDEDRAKYGRGGTDPCSIVATWEQLELSATVMPCNVSCQGAAVTDSRAYDDMDRLIRKGRVSIAAARLLGFEDAVSRKSERRSIIYIDD